jgi:hypothetical protein
LESARRRGRVVYLEVERIPLGGVAGDHARTIRNSGQRSACSYDFGL